MKRTGFPHVAKQTHAIFHPTFRVHKGSVICIFHCNKKVFEDKTLKEGARVRHMKTHVHTTGFQRTDLRSTQTLRTDLQNTRPYFPTHTPADPTLASCVTCIASSRCTGTQKFRSRAPHKKPIYIAAVRLTGCLSLDI